MKTKVLITGANGFVGKNLIVKLKAQNYSVDIFSKEDSLNELKNKAQKSDIIFHLAGSNRPKDNSEFYEVNRDLTKALVDFINGTKEKKLLVFSSSIQAENNSDYGQSKRAAEEYIENQLNSNLHLAYIFRLPNLFGKWCNPFYNSVIATWCHLITNDKEIEISDPEYRLNLCYIDDLVGDFEKCITDGTCDLKGAFYKDVSKVYNKSLGEIASSLMSFNSGRENLKVDEVGTDFLRALYSTYLSYLPKEKISYSLKDHSDDRGSFYEVLKTNNSGQFSVSTTKPGVTRGEHYHHSKNEKFIVVKGEAHIALRHLVSNEVIEFNVSENSPQVVDMIPGYTHNITNTGKDDMILLIWANEVFDPSSPDTYFEKVFNNEDISCS